MILVYTTCKDDEEATRISERILKERLGVAVNRWPMHASYLSEEQVKTIPATALLIQTLETKFQDIEDLMTQERSYATPFVGLIDLRRLSRAFRERFTDVLR